MIPAKSATVANRLLASLPENAGRRLLAVCEPVVLEYAEVLGEPGEPIQYVYFPMGSYIALVEKVDGHACLEVGLIGNEGMLGTALVLGVDLSPLHAVVQGPGPALRMDAALFALELEASPELRHALKRYIYITMQQLAQSAACTHFHLVEARLARWLLTAQDKAHSSKFHVTHEWLAYLLGVRRVGITRAATALHNRKLIDYSRGDVTILDRAGLKVASCGCYAVDRANYARMKG